MLRSPAVVVLLVLGSTAPASAQLAGPLAGPGVPSYNPGVPSYNPGVPRQAPGVIFGNGQVPRLSPGIPPAGNGARFVRPRIYPQVIDPYYAYGSQTIIVVPPAIVVPPQPRRTTMDNPFFGDLGDPFF